MTPLTRCGRGNTQSVGESHLLDQGHTIRATPLTANFDFAAFREKWDDRAIPLFALDSKGILRVFSTGESPRPSPGWTLISLMPPADAGGGSSAG